MAIHATYSVGRAEVVLSYPLTAYTLLGIPL